FSIVPPLRSGAKIELWHIPCKYSPLISSPNHASTCGSAGYFYTLAPTGGACAEYLAGKQAGKDLWRER
ncbi:hypothetical protein, partial [Sphingobacterium deserti]|uniref:hypothetical protein n=1 Tax=Sphingobacterium deserti TaxID=1229276 RepID=UPI00056D3BFA